MKILAYKMNQCYSMRLCPTVRFFFSPMQICSQLQPCQVPIKTFCDIRLPQSPILMPLLQRPPNSNFNSHTLNHPLHFSPPHRYPKPPTPRLLPYGLPHPLPAPVPPHHFPMPTHTSTLLPTSLPPVSFGE